MTTADDVLALRRAAWPDGRIDPAEAEAILALDEHVTGKSPEWLDFVAEATVEVVVNGREPRGYLDDATADWLIARLDHDGRLDSLSELDLLVRIMEKSLNTPEPLKLYALAQIERAVLSGNGPTRDGGSLDAGCITASECALLRRMIFAAGSDGPGRVSRAEAELLFRIKDATLGAANAPEWPRLFVQGVGNYLQGWQGPTALTRERAAELETFMNDRSSGVGAFFKRMFRVDRAAFGQVVHHGALGTDGQGRDALAQAAANADVDDAERLWLDARVGADASIDPLETALQAFLAER